MRNCFRTTATFLVLVVALGTARLAESNANPARDDFDRHLHKGPAQNILRSTTNASGGRSSGGPYVLISTVGQPITDESYGGPYSLNGGIHPQSNGQIFSDGFEAGNFDRWASALP